MEWYEEGPKASSRHAEKLDAHVQPGRSAEDGRARSGGGAQSKLATLNHADYICIRVGTIDCSAFGGPGRCGHGLVS